MVIEHCHHLLDVERLAHLHQPRHTIDASHALPDQPEPATMGGRLCPHLPVLLTGEYMADPGGIDHEPLANNWFTHFHQQHSLYDIGTIRLPRWYRHLIALEHGDDRLSERIVLSAAGPFGGQSLLQPFDVLPCISHGPQGRRRKTPLAGHQALEKTIKRVLLIGPVNGHRQVNGDRPSLADAMHAVVALLLDGRVPPAGQMYDVGRSSQRQARTSRLGAENENVEASVVFQMALETVYDRLALRNGRIAIDQVGVMKAQLAAHQFYEPVLHLPVLNEHQSAFTLRLDPPQNVD